MAVLVEGISVIIKIESLKKLSVESQTKILKAIPNKTLCWDGELMRVGFMTPRDVKRYADYLESMSLKFIEGGNAIDFVVVDQLNGPTANCSWVDYRTANLNGKGNLVKCCWLSGSTLNVICTPTGWSFQESLSNNPGFFSEEEIPNKLKFLRKEEHLDVYLNIETGEKVFIGRPDISGVKHHLN